MKKSILLNKNKKAFLALSLAGVSALSLCLMTACNDDEEEKTDTSVVNKTDKETIANGNFEYYTESLDLSSVISPSGWTKSVGTDANGSSALSSSKASGIVNTEFTHWSDLTLASATYKEGMPLNEVTAAWKDEFTIHDRLAFYHAVQNGDYKEEGVSALSDFVYYDDYKYPIGIDDVPTCANPGTRNGIVNATNANAANAEASVLMIHNYRSDGYGTAQKYTSSTSVSVPANTSAKFSVWVKTMGLTYDNGVTVDEDRGAYIGVTHTVGGKTLEQMQIKNIVTSGTATNNGWKQYTVYLKGSSHATSTFNIVLGLGQGSSVNRYENVDGYAFFDDVTCEKITNAEYDEATRGVPTCYAYDETAKKQFKADKEYGDNDVFALDLYGAFESIDFANDVALSYGLTEDDSIDGKVYTTSGANSYKGLNIETKNDVTMSGKIARLKSVKNAYLASILEKDFASFPFDSNENIVMLMSANGASYTAKMTNGKNAAFTLEPHTRKAISFFAKTSALDGYTGASVKLIDGENESVISSFDTTVLSTLDTDNEKDLYGGWAQCFFFVENETNAKQSFSLEFSFGPTSIVGTSRADYLEGYAAFTAFETREMSKMEYDNISTGSRAVAVSLAGEKETQTVGFDSVIYSNESAIETGFATPLNYQGVVGGSYYVGGTSDEKANANENAGLLNVKYADAYYETDWAKALIAAAKDSSLTTALDKDNWFGAIFGSAAQPLVILNAVEQSYGYIATASSAVAASSYSTIAMDVTVGKGAVAYVYLIDTTSLQKGYRNALKVETPKVTFWYDDDGNICTKDPSADEFNQKKDVAFYLNKNGLYESADKSDKTLYANLKAYQTASEYDEKSYPAATDAGKNLVTADGKVSFYYHDGAYYGEYDESKGEYLLPVSDIPESFAAEYARYIGEEGRELFTVIDNRDGNETIRETVTYYVATGNETKNYRLEVFSGNREGTVKSKAGSFVAFDSVSYNSLSSSYDKLLTEAIDKIAAEDNGVTLDKESGRLVKDGKTYENATYYTYTFYDSASYVRYDENADPTNGYVVYSSAEDDPGNLYYGYQQSENEEEVVYLKDGYTTFVNFGAIDKTTTPDHTHDNDQDEDKGVQWTSELFMMIASIALSAVLLFTMVALFVKRVMKDRRKNKVDVIPQYRSQRKVLKKEDKKD